MRGWFVVDEHAHADDGARGLTVAITAYVCMNGNVEKPALNGGSQDSPILRYQSPLDLGGFRGE